MTLFRYDLLGPSNQVVELVAWPIGLPLTLSQYNLVFYVEVYLLAMLVCLLLGPSLGPF